MSDNIHIKLPDGSDKEMPKGTTALDVAKSISPRLADAAIAAKISSNGGPAGEDHRVDLPEQPLFERLPVRRRPPVGRGPELVDDLAHVPLAEDPVRCSGRQRFTRMCTVRPIPDVKLPSTMRTKIR